jgi:Family of unknown function (DUF5678)
MAINWEKIYQAHKGLWVALQDDEVTVIASAPTAKKALEESRKKGYQNPILALMPRDLSPFVG